MHETCRTWSHATRDESGLCVFTEGVWEDGENEGIDREGLDGDGRAWGRSISVGHRMSRRKEWHEKIIRSVSR